ncbi:hypothetical protein RMSM_00690 [Rhodopirellula maiorica SM1]|uniref:Uncharacterized protein n=1 Tax=Rhodopirellula maiorica SM1 TaxID=1265738 RepID=M5RSR5_9BACT|nr:hypothetical protein [Rhodopirellula maiorica]EMI22378.1 hypothetical protein RMSM_00690 [Rhodopirellula maiorica SM1]
MNDPFVKSQWQILCEDLKRCANAIAVCEEDAAEYARQSEAFANQPQPERYPDLLKKTAEAAELAVQWQQRRGDEVPNREDTVHAHEEEMIDEASDESFPASDPPSFSHAHA